MDNKSNEKAYIDLVCHPLSTLGPYTRVGIWFQGCDIGCHDCIATFTWKQTDEKLMTINDLVYKIKEYGVHRLTISGGEPFNQPDALYDLLVKSKKNFDDILVYSGYEYEYLQKNFSNILDLIDVLVDGPFINTLYTNKIYKGSKNQKMYIFNNNLINDYGQYMVKKKGKLQLYQIENDTYILGIPNISDTKKIQKILNGVLEDE